MFLQTFLHIFEHLSADDNGPRDHATFQTTGTNHSAFSFTFAEHSKTLFELKACPYWMWIECASPWLPLGNQCEFIASKHRMLPSANPDLLKPRPLMWQNYCWIGTFHAVASKWMSLFFWPILCCLQPTWTHVGPTVYVSKDIDGTGTGLFRPEGRIPEEEEWEGSVCL